MRGGYFGTRPFGVPGRLCGWCVWLCWCSERRLISGRRVACPPARRPRSELSARRVVSKPGQAPPPPTGTAARPFGPAGALHTSGARCADGRGASSRSPPWPCRRPPAPQPGPGLMYVAQLWLSIINFACNSPTACSNIEFASLELQRFLGLLKFGLIELHAKFVWLGSCRRLSNFARNSPAAC